MLWGFALKCSINEGQSVKTRPSALLKQNAPSVTSPGLEVLNNRRTSIGLSVRCWTGSMPLPALPIQRLWQQTFCMRQLLLQAAIILGFLKKNMEQGDVRGLSGKFPNISRKNFPVLPWSYSALSPSKSSPLLCMHRCQRFFNAL